MKNTAKIIVSLTISLYLVFMLTLVHAKPSWGLFPAEAWEISTARQLMAIASEKGGYRLDHHYRLIADIDLTGINWKPIGSEKAPFTGSFNGGGHTISGLSVDMTSSDAAGFFGTISLATITNLNLIDVKVSGSHLAGGLAGDCISSRIDNCVVSGMVSGSLAGGIAGSLKSPGTILKNSKSLANVSAVAAAGGIAGESNGGQIRSCVSYGDVSGGGYAGAITGLSIRGAIIDCIALSARVAAEKTAGRISGAVSPFAEFSNVYASGGMSVEIGGDTVDVSSHTEATANGRHGKGLSASYVINYYRLGEDEPFASEEAVASLMDEANAAGEGYVSMKQPLEMEFYRTVPAFFDPLPIDFNELMSLAQSSDQYGRIITNKSAEIYFMGRAPVAEANPVTPPNPISESSPIVRSPEIFEEDTIITDDMYDAEIEFETDSEIDFEISLPRALDIAPPVQERPIELPSEVTLPNTGR